jgi:CRP-like cAMP-binding protein
MKLEELERKFAGDESILDSGSNARELFVVRSGTCTLVPNDGGEGRMLGPGEFFGELGAVLGEPSPYAVRADGEMTVLALDAGALNEMCRQSPDFAARLVRHLAQELAASATSGAIAPEDARVREGLAKLVPVLFDRRSADTPAVSGRLCELAEAAGLSPLEAYTCVQSLLERRYLQLVDDQLTLVEPEALRDLVH